MRAGIRRGYNRLVNKLTHLDRSGAASMVDVSPKPVAQRRAVAEARLRMQPETLAEILDQGLPKGDALAVARVAGIQAAKRCADLIPLCHPLPLSRVSLEFAPAPPEGLRIRAECRTLARTGVEMEALIAASVAALTIYDMCKALDRGMAVQEVRLLSKEGGRSGAWKREEAP